jgi:hypothetical protein
MAASASALSAQLDSHNVGIKGSVARAERLVERLISPEDGTAAYAYDHAEEELLWIAAELEYAAKRVRGLVAYTVTGEKRAEQDKALASSVQR